jgi:hypothetical protein
VCERMFPLAHEMVDDDGGDAPAQTAGAGALPSRPRAPRAAGILRLVRDFLLLEDDYEVGWEAEYVKEDQAPGLRRHAAATATPSTMIAAPDVRCPGACAPRHRPHHLAGARRCGQPHAKPQLCVSALSRPSPGGFWAASRAPECCPDRRATERRG